jgi:Fe-S-cluster containining protein
MLHEHREEILKLFKCQQSGNCCRYPGFVYVTPENIKRMSAILNLSEEEFFKEYVQIQNGWPIIASKTFHQNCFLDCNNKCKVYEGRPDPCKSYPNWDQIWQSDESLIHESLLCPGLDKAISQYKSKQNFE